MLIKSHDTVMICLLGLLKLESTRWDFLSKIFFHIASRFLHVLSVLSVVPALQLSSSRAHATWLRATCLWKIVIIIRESAL